METSFFAAVEQVVEQVWHRKELSLRALDYCDLRRLYSFFSFLGKLGKEETVKITSSKERHLILKVAWKSHRRQIINALPVLAKLVKNSVTSFGYELYGTGERRERIRTVISEAISDINLIANDSKVVEDTLMYLAADDNIQVQIVVAKSLANWRSFDKRELVQRNNENSSKKEYSELDKKLFETIERWQNDARYISIIKSFLEGKDHNKNREPLDYLRSTIALTVGYASRFDLPDRMPKKLLEILWLLICDSNDLVQKSLLSYALPEISKRHIIQIEGKLKAFLLKDEHVTEILRRIHGVSDILVSTYRFRPQEVLTVLDLWQSEAKSTKQRRPSKDKFDNRETLFLVIEKAYGGIDFLSENQMFIGSKDKALIALKEALKFLQELVVNERHFLVREWAIHALLKQAQKNFDMVEPRLKKIAGEISKSERQCLADILTDIYLEQRSNLPDGEENIKFKIRQGNELIEKDYPVWLDSKRPLTEVEEAMLNWLKDDKNPMAQQIAVRASANFYEAFDKQEFVRIEALRKTEEEEVRETEVVEEDIPPIQVGHPPQGLYLGKLIPKLATWYAEDYEDSIRNLLPEGLFQKNKNRDNFDPVLLKWSHSSDQDIKFISRRLNLGISLAKKLKHYTAWAGVVLVSMGTTYCGIYLKENPDSEVLDVPLGSSISPPAPIDSDITLSDPSGFIEPASPNFEQGQLIVEFSENGTSNDRLGIRSQGEDATDINLKGNQVVYGDKAIGQFEGGSGTKPLVVDLNANATPESLQALMRNVTYHNVVAAPSLGLRKVEFQVTDDAGVESNTIVRSIWVTQGNQAPQLKIPNDQIVNENMPLQINGIGFEDPDSTKRLTIILSVEQGTITVSDSVDKGLRAQNITNNNSAKVTLVGNAGQISSTLSAPNAVIYKGSNNTSFKVEIDDGGLDVPGEIDDILIWPVNPQAAKTDQGDFDIKVNPGNKIPKISIANPQQVIDGNQDLILGNITIDDPDSSELTVVLQVEHGTLSVRSGISQGLMSNEISNNHSSKVILTGKRDKVRATLLDPRALIYKGSSEFRGMIV